MYMLSDMADSQALFTQLLTHINIQHSTSVKKGGNII
jgi:hypothetical protein